MTPEWKATRRENPHRRPIAFERPGARVARYTTASRTYPMIRWKVVFDDGREFTGLDTAEAAMRYADDYLSRHPLTP